MRLLLISNSTNAGEAYLEYPKRQIADFLAGSAAGGDRAVDTVLFVPYAAVTFSYDEYEAKVAARFGEFGVRVDSVHRHANPAEAVRRAQAIVVGGGNTFHLAKTMQDQGLYEPIREAVLERGVPYVGWSAGSNMSCPTICTTNDMPIVEPLSFKALNLIPFQINPHYLDAHPDGHAGETREMRIEEYIAANKGMNVAGLREGCMLWVENGRMSLIGERPMRLFRYGQAPRELTAKDDLSFLL
ncbi:dipeptidase PepE [uncultured Rikenella sp.]|uniref:dipeptidase PepE n=1 Tax=uncultured Rikenella sp. TaxID=368003 RepID=UPI002601884A|nr:dipeptidase PepE [uncultured Rikenella sp.]